MTGTAIQAAPAERTAVTVTHATIRAFPVIPEAPHAPSAVLLIPAGIP
jgi:hypothetical protein